MGESDGRSKWLVIHGSYSWIQGGSFNARRTIDPANFAGYRLRRRLAAGLPKST
jgi:hypothetical protein